MKIHYTNILLFPLKLNILVNTHQKPHTTARHTQKIPTTRSLSECELYAPVNYYSDPQMKEVMDNFNKQTQQRFHEYDERVQNTRQKCKEQCDKEIQKIILKDKIEKELNEKFSALHTDIQSDDIPTCICEMSMADKVEKGCLRCVGVFGGGIAPSVGLLGGLGIYVWKPGALKVAITAALNANSVKIAAAANAAGEAMGVKTVIEGLKALNVHGLCPDLFESIGTKIHYTNAEEIAKIIVAKYRATCNLSTGTSSTQAMCKQFDYTFGMRIRLGSPVEYGPPPASAIPDTVKKVVAGAEQAAEAKAANVRTTISSKIITEETDVINTIYMSNQTAIIASIIAIVIIVLIMVIIYLILRYRRKKKMKKKLQYIKLLEE
ncbi:rifin [Plasmodium falciparum NF54]|uniref:Rifin n=2 Tax=Plasmodium falciparum TaxID=5833 RepID=C6KTF4_PLAF7|nr:rifin [Plasmodium falciparum 3D7]EWC89561.1 hypothetical protein PFNF54_01632 [Plasmodium falciparum NF54]KAF4327542.1 rifin [Plasmodium falciparum NF54]PKC42808.1 rifin [Plasmodium falciparum NF54]CAG25134.1 rifin [Plasmodium falciparum 3D7]|eukprot:XP_966302.1 rifin [Plasmodium falciparum 3D7]